METLARGDRPCADPRRLDRRTRWLLFAWTATALAFALRRLPYDDELFSLSLARDATWAQLSESLARDVHPPYVAWLDRATAQLAGGAWGIFALHALASSAAIALTARAVAAIGGRGWLVVAAAFHPIVFMYGGAARWYAFAFLADALRLFAIARAHARLPGAPIDRATKLGFALGAATGPMAGYLEAPRVAFDAIAWLVVERRRGSAGDLRSVAGTIAIASLAPIAALLAWPFTRAQLALAAPIAISSRAAIPTFLALGPLGEAHLVPPWTALAIVALPGLGLAIARAWLDFRPIVVAAAGALVAWTACAPLGAGHPRYGLLAWLLFAAAAIHGASTARSSGARALVGVTAAYVALGLALTIGQHSFVKAELDELDDRACGPVFAARSDVVVVPSPRLRDLLERACRPTARPIAARWIRRDEPGDPSLVAALVDPVARARSVTLVTSTLDQAWPADPERRARALVARRCRLVSRDAPVVVADAFASLKRWLSPPPDRYRLQIDRFECP